MDKSTYYFPRTIENVTIAFMSIFNNMIVKKYDKQTQEVKSEKHIPITWGPIDKPRNIRKENFNEEQNAYYMTLPRMAVSGPSFNYNADRATDVNGVRQHYSEALGLNDIDSFYSDIPPSPWDYTYTLHIKADKMGYVTQILENILPYFNPDMFLRVKEFSFLDIERDLKVLIGGSVTPQFDPMDQAEDSKRIIDIEIDFTIEGWMYLPIGETSTIKFIDSKYFINNTFDDISLATSANSEFVDSYSTSGFEATSAGDAPSEVPTDGFNFSAYSPDLDLYSYTSASE